jgi:two-component system sensor histidine kinase/response regulator
MNTDDDNLKIKILTVDDNSKNLQVLGSILRDAGYSVGFANNGEQALNILGESPDFDLVLLDINMPVMGGLETCKAMRSDKILKEIPVIFLTALTDTKDVIEGFDAGGQDYVTKPFSSNEILSRVKTHVELKRNRDQLKKVNQWLEEKVEERTQALQESHLELEKAYQELKVLDQSKSDFLAIISHQINTPLNGILGFIGLLKDELTDPHLQEMFSYLEISANRLDSFSKVSLKITELKTKQLTLEKREINFINLLELSQKHLTEKLNTKNINIQLEDNTPNKILHGDMGLLEFSVESILDNAIKYAPNGSIIHVKIDADEKNTRCSFSDQGIGFDSEAIKSLFNLFATGDEYADENKGLDLALVKLIMEAHEGEIVVSNNEDKGATITLLFPN